MTSFAALLRTVCPSELLKKTGIITWPPSLKPKCHIGITVPVPFYCFSHAFDRGVPNVCSYTFDLKNNII